MLITSEIELKPGQTVTEKDTNGRPFEYMGEFFYIFTIYVMRVSTKEEYTEYIRELKPDTDFDNFLYYEFYYEVSMD